MMMGAGDGLGLTGKKTKELTVSGEVVAMA